MLINCVATTPLSELVDKSILTEQARSLLRAIFPGYSFSVGQIIRPVTPIRFVVQISDWREGSPHEGCAVASVPMVDKADRAETLLKLAADIVQAVREYEKDCPCQSA